MAQAQQETLIREEPSPVRGSAHLLLQNIGYLAGSQVITWVASLLYTVIVTRAIGPRGNGELNSALALVGILGTLVGFGSATYLVKEIAGDPTKAPRLVGTTLMVQLLALAPAAAATATYLSVDHFSREMTIVFILFGLGLPPAVFSQTLQAALQGIQRMGVIAASGAVTTLVYDAVVIGLVLAGDRDVVLIAALLLAAQYGALALTVVFYRRYFPPNWRIRVSEPLGVIRGSLPFLSIQIAFAFYLAADTLILTTLSSSTEVGWYAAVNRLFASLLVVSTILSTAWLPRLAAHARTDTEALRKEARMVVRLVLVSAVPLAIGGCLVAGRLVHLIWGPAFEGAGAPMSVLILSLPATSVCTVLYQVLVARGREGVWAWVMAIALVLNVLGNVALILWFRADGRSTAVAAAICLSITEGGMAVVAIWMTRHDVGLRMLWYAMRTLAAGLVMGAVVLLVSGLALGFVIAIGSLVFCLLAVAFKLVSREELAAGHFLFKKVTRR